MALRFASNEMASLTGVALAAFVVLAGTSLPAAAQGTPPAAGATQSVGVQTFLAEPAALLRQNPAGGSVLISQVRDLAVASQSTLQPIINLLANASKDQKTAIASGLAQAAKIVVKTNAPYATQIQLAIADTKDQDVVLAYAGAAGDVPIGAGGGAGAGSAGASGGQTTGLGGPTGTGSAQAINGSSTATGAFSYTSSVSGGSSTTSGTTAGTTTNTFTILVTTVSP